MIGYGKSLGTFAEKLEWVIERQLGYLANRVAESSARPPKYRIRGMETEAGWQYWADLVPCPVCNPPRDPWGNFIHFAQETFGTVEWCKKHQAFWDDFSARYGHMLSPASTKAVKFPSV
jgi:hypothetical protein